MSGSRLYALEMEAYIAGSGPAAERGHATRPHAVAPPLPGALEATDTILASDLGYRTRPGDPVQAIYPPLLERAFEIDRTLPLAPGEEAAGVAWGTLRLLNPDGRWNGIAATRSCDGRPLRVLTGRRSFDRTRGIEVDPAYASLVVVFAGVAQGWFPTEAALEVPLRDATYWIERPLQDTYYLGTGGYEGPVALRGTAKPRLRGGTSALPVRNVAPLLVDPVARIYAFSDGPAGIAAIYEGGLLNNITWAGNVASLYTGTTPPGQFRADPDRGLLQLGSPPVRPITLDVASYQVASVPAASVPTTAVALARSLLLDDLLVPAAALDLPAFAALDAAYPATSGWYFDREVSAVDAVGIFLRGIGAKLLPTRDGKLRPVTLRALPDGILPAATWSTEHIVDLVPSRMPPPLDPPADRWMVGYQHNHTLQTSDLAPGATDTHVQFLAQEWRQALWYSAAVNAAYRRPSRPGLIPTALLAEADAQALVNAHGGLWGTRRRLYDCILPSELAHGRDLGDVVMLRYPMDDLAGGRLGRIVGEQYRSSDPTTVLRILV